MYRQISVAGVDNSAVFNRVSQNQTKVIAVANHKRRRQYSEPISSRSEAKRG